MSRAQSFEITPDFSWQCEFFRTAGVRRDVAFSILDDSGVATLHLGVVEHRGLNWLHHSPLTVNFFLLYLVAPCR